MDESNIKTGWAGRLGWIKRYSPFAFDTLKEFPWPTWPVLFTVLFFGIVWRGYEYHFDHSQSMIPGSHIPILLREERAKQPKKTQVLIGGSSVAGAIDPEYMEKNLGMPVLNVQHKGGTPWEFYKILKKYPKECQYARVVMHDLEDGMLRPRKLYTGILPGHGHLQAVLVGKPGYFLLKEWNDWAVPNERIVVTWAEAVLPARYSLRSIVKDYGASRRYNGWFVRVRNQNRNPKELGTPLPTGNRAGLSLHLDNRDISVVNNKDFRFDLDAYMPHYKNAQYKITTRDGDKKPTTFRDIYLEAERTATNCKVRTVEPQKEITNTLPFDEQARQNILEFVEYCRTKGIFVVFHIPPKWKPYTGRCPGYLPTWETAKDIGEFKFLLLIDELNRLPNCTVVNLDAFQSLYPGKPSELFLSDQHHLIGYGPKVYMDWLCDQMLKDPKIAAALKKPRKPEEFIVKRGVRKTWRMLAGYFKKTTPDNKAIQVAAPQGATIR